MARFSQEPTARTARAGASESSQFSQFSRATSSSSSSSLIASSGCWGQRRNDLPERKLWVAVMLQLQDDCRKGVVRAARAKFEGAELAEVAGMMGIGRDAMARLVMVEVKEEAANG